MQCPNCNLSLALGEAEWHIGYTCEQCAGMWLPPKYLDSLKHVHAFDAEQFKRVLTRSKIGSKPIRSCPSCNALLVKSQTGNIELDWCEKCQGVWFDRKELTQLVTHRAGEAQIAANTNGNPVGVIVLLITQFMDSYFEKHPEQIPPIEADADGYVPNYIPSKERVQNLLFSILLFAYGSYGVYANDLYIPGKRSKGVHLHDFAAWAMYGAMLCACLVLFSVIVDHYDRRNNEKHYRWLANVFKFLGWGCFGVSFVLLLTHK